MEVAAQSTRVHPSLQPSFVTPHSGNFISHNRALKPLLRTSFTPTLPAQLSFSLSSPRFLVSFPLLPGLSHPSFFFRFFRRGLVVFVLQRELGLFDSLALRPPRVYELSSLSFSSFSSSFFSSFRRSFVFLDSVRPFLSSTSDSNAHQRQYLTAALTVG